MKTDLFQSCGHCWVFQICWHIECSTFTASTFRIWNSSTGIPSPPLALFVCCFLSPTWPHIPGCLALGLWSHHRDYLGHEDFFGTVLQSSGKSKLKWQWTPNKIAKIKKTTPGLVRAWSSCCSHLLLPRTCNGTTTVENYLAASYDRKHTFTLWPRHPAYHYPRKLKNMSIKRL